MPFLAECILCHQKVRVPDRAAGASVQCPRCKSYFTAAPDDDLVPAAKGARGGAVTAAAPPSPLPPVAGPAPAPPAAEGRAAPEVDEASPALSSAAIFAGPTRPAVARPPIDAIGFASLVFGGLAPPCACVVALTVLVIPLAAIGLIVGMGRLAVAYTSPRPRFVLAAAGSVLSAAGLVIAVVFPSLLGPTYALSRSRAEPEVVTPRPVPLAGQKVAAGEERAEWVDASKFSIQIRKVRVQLAEANVRPLETLVKGKKKLTKESYLLLRVRTLQPAGAAEFTSDAWGSATGASQRPQPALTDISGKAYARAPTEVAEALRQAQQSALFPVGVTDEIYLFEAPPPGTQGLRMEMSAAAWGGNGAMRFAIPASMIRGEATAPPERSK